MVRSSTLTEEPLINCIVHEDNVCTVGVTNFHVNINPAGMALIKSIDPTAIFIERYEHTIWAKSAMHWAKVTKDQLRGVEGFGQLYESMVEDTGLANGPNYSHMLLTTGFPYEVDVKESSPLVGWFNVMKGVSND
jgi:hypothetical protein